MSERKCGACFALFPETETACPECGAAYYEPKPQQAKPAHPSHRSFPPREPWAGPTAYGTATLAKIRADLEKFTKRVPDRSWAPRVLERVRRGEHIFPAGVEWAQQVVQQPERAPGEDDA